MFKLADLIKEKTTVTAAKKKTKKKASNGSKANLKACEKELTKLKKMLEKDIDRAKMAGESTEIQKEVAKNLEGALKLLEKSRDKSEPSSPYDPESFKAPKGSKKE